MALGGTNYNLRCSTNNDPWASFEITAAVAYTAGQMVLINDTVCVAIGTAAIGDQVVFNYQAAKIRVPCQTVTTGSLANMAAGSKLYFDAADANVNTVAAGNTLCGIVVVDAAAGDSYVVMHLMGCLGIVA